MHKQIDENDIQAEREAKAIIRSKQSRCHTSHIRKTYKIDGDRFNTGQKHRPGGWAAQ